MLTITVLKQKANEAGYSFQHGKQHWLPYGWGYRTEGGKAVEGYQILNRSTGCLVWPSYTDMYDHALSLNEAVGLLRELCAEKGITL